jgi:hypothetical protein
MPGRDWGSTPTPTSYNRLSNSGSTRGLLGNADDMSRSDSHQSLLTGEDRVRSSPITIIPPSCQPILIDTNRRNT